MTGLDPEGLAVGLGPPEGREMVGLAPPPGRAPGLTMFGRGLLPAGRMTGGLEPPGLPGRIMGGLFPPGLPGRMAGALLRRGFLV